MRRILLILLICTFAIIPVSAMEFEPPDVPEEGEIYMPENTESFTEAMWYVLKQAVADLWPSLAQSAAICFRVVVCVILISVLNGFSGPAERTVHLAGAVMIGILLLSPSGKLISVGVNAIQSITSYSQLLLPVLTGALAAQGGINSSAALYSTTAFFSSLLSLLITKISIQLLYIYLSISIAAAAINNDLLKQMQKFLKWIIVWSMKIVLYVFTGFISITGVVSGSADASAVKAVKLSLSGMIPVVGNVISEASETILVSAGIMKNAAGIYGMIAILSVVIGPFLQIGAQYITLKITAAICSVFDMKNESGLIADISAGMGMLLGMTGTVCLLLMIGITCYMRGMSG